MKDNELLSLLASPARFAVAVSVALWLAFSPNVSWSMPRNLQELVLSAGTTPAALSLSPGSWYVSANLEVPKNVRIRVERGATISVSSGKKLVLRGAFEAPAVPVFLGKGKVLFNGSTDQRLLPQWWGAKGDGVTNDTAAFAAVAAAICAAGGGRIDIPAGTYIVGSQEFAGVTGRGYAYSPANILWIRNCERQVIVKGHRGTVLKAAPGLRIGAFDPVTGLAIGKSTRADNRADAYWGMLRLENNKGGVTVKDIELDGNVSTATVGGTFGDTGYQVAAYGIYAYGNNSLDIENVYSHHHAADGMIIGYAGLTESSPPHPYLLKRVTCEYNGRQGLSWVGGNSLTVIDSKFNNTGRNGIISSAPGAGVDVEAESSVNRNGSFINCEMVNNIGPGMVADSGDSKAITFTNCTFWGTTTWSLWPRKPNLQFFDCKIYGAMSNVYASASRENGVLFKQCEFEDKNYPGFGVYRGGGYLVNIADGKNAAFDHCSFTANRVRGGYIVSYAKNMQDAIRVTNSSWLLMDDTVMNRSAQLVLAGVYLENVTINEDYQSPPSDGYYVEYFNNYVWIGDNCRTTGKKTFWRSWSPGAGGRLGLALKRWPAQD